MLFSLHWREKLELQLTWLSQAPVEASGRYQALVFVVQSFFSDKTRPDALGICEVSKLMVFRKKSKDRQEHWLYTRVA